MKKNRIGIYMTALLLALNPVRVRADSGDSFQLDSSGQVTLDSFHAAKEGISSISFSLTVEPEDAAKVEFVFQGVSAEILEYRYHADEKKMNIYMAGTKPLFAEGAESLTVGKVVISDGSGKATVGVVPDSLKFVYGSTQRDMEGVGIPENVRIGGADTPPPTQEPPVETPPVETPPANTPEPTPPAPSTPTPAPSTPTPAPPPVSTPPPQHNNNTPSTPAPSDTPPVVVPRPTRNPAGYQTGATATPKPEEDPDESELYEPTPIPLETESPSPEPDDIEEDPFVLPSSGADGEGGESEGGGGFFGEIRLILAGLAIAATVAGTGAVAVGALIRKPKDR